MTAIATILALVPLAAGFNEGSIIAAELGTVVIGGLLSSTFLTLIVVPVVYSLVDSGKSRLSRRGGSGEPAIG
jgi:HAE1 family hydrophobic/amphiphilic exporter-1